MKALLIALSLVVASSASASSAFTHDNNLYLTILGDSCNTLSASLKVDDLCRRDRVTANQVKDCRVDLLVMSTAMACEEQTTLPTAKVIKIDLAQTLVDNHATRLIIGQGENKMVVKINRMIVDEKMFCRTIVRDGSFGQPKGEAQHCVRFSNGKMADNANTFFGNPPTLEDFKVVGNKIITTSGAKEIARIAFTIVDRKLVNEVGAVLTEQK